MNVLRVLSRYAVRLLEWVVTIAFIALSLTVIWGVFTRFVFGDQAGWTEEAAIYLLIWVSLLGASLTYAEHGHLGVDYLVSKFDSSAHWLSALVVELVVLFFATSALLYGGWVLVFETLAQGQVSPTLGWKVGYLYAAVPLSGVFFFLFALEHFVGLLKRGVYSSDAQEVMVD